MPSLQRRFWHVLPDSYADVLGGLEVLPVLPVESWVDGHDGGQDGRDLQVRLWLGLGGCAPH